jgi:hypothetical protein
MAVTRDGAGDIDEMHDRPAENEPERVGVVRQDNLDHFGRGISGSLGREVHCGKLRLKREN